MAEKKGGGDPPAEEEEEEDKNHGGADGGASPQKETDDGNKKEKKHSDRELLMCLLQPCPADADPEYIGIRRLLLSRKSQSSILRRLDWRCNGKGYVAFRNYIRRPRNWEKDSLRTPSLQTTPGNRLLDASVGDGFNLRVHSHFCVTSRAGLLAGMCIVAVNLHLVEVLARVLVIMTALVDGVNSLHTLL